MIMYCVRDPCVIRRLVRIILKKILIYFSFCLLQATWWWSYIQQKPRFKIRTKPRYENAVPSGTLPTTACWQACSDRAAATVEGALRPRCLRRGLVRRSCKNVTLEALETQLRLPRPLPHWRLPRHWSTATAVAQRNGRLHSFHSFLRCCLSVIRPQRIEVSMALAHISRRPSMTEAAGGRSDRGYRGCSWEQDHSCSLHLANSLLLVTEFYTYDITSTDYSYPLSNSGV